MTTWDEFRKELNITEDEEKIISIEKELIRTMVEIREEQGLSQAELAKKQVNLAKTELERDNPYIEKVKKIQAELNAIDEELEKNAKKDEKKS